MEGYFEWKNIGEKRKQPYYIANNNKDYLILGALYDSNKKLNTILDSSTYEIEQNTQSQTQKSKDIGSNIEETDISNNIADIEKISTNKNKENKENGVNTNTNIENEHTKSYLDENEKRVLILTQEANSYLMHIHDRMPVILEEDEIEKWINCKHPKEFLALLSNIKNRNKTLNEAYLKAYPVCDLVNKITNNKSDVIVHKNDGICDKNNNYTLNGLFLKKHGVKLDKGYIKHNHVENKKLNKSVDSINSVNTVNKATNNKRKKKSDNNKASSAILMSFLNKS